MSGAARRLVDHLRKVSAAWIGCTMGSLGRNGTKHVADRKASAPNRIDHGVIGAGGLNRPARSAHRCRVSGSVN